MPMPTISDVAQRAGVSTKTVSRVMNNYEHISTKTREKVERAIEELNFLPGFGSPVSRIGESLSIGMLYGDPSSGYQARLNHAVLKACSDARRYLAVELFDEKNVDKNCKQPDGLPKKSREVRQVELKVPPKTASGRLRYNRFTKAERGSETETPSSGERKSQ